MLREQKRQEVGQSGNDYQSLAFGEFSFFGQATSRHNDDFHQFPPSYLTLQMQCIAGDA